MPRSPHKEGCMCAVCRRKRAKVESVLPVEPKIVIEPEIVPPSLPSSPIEVRLDSLPLATKFIYHGQEHQVNERVEGIVVCYSLFLNDTVTLGGSTLVKPIK